MSSLTKSFVSDADSFAQPQLGPGLGWAKAQDVQLAAQETTAKHEKAHFDDCREASNARCCCHLLSR